MLGTALATLRKLPIHGLRIRLDGTCGRLIWGGEDVPIDLTISRFTLSRYLLSAAISAVLVIASRLPIPNGRRIGGRLIRLDTVVGEVLFRFGSNLPVSGDSTAAARAVAGAQLRI